MKDTNPKEPQGIPSPYQNAGEDVEIAEVHYRSPAKGEMVFLGKTIRRISPEGKLTYTLLDPSDRIMGPPVDDEQTAKEIWGSVASMLEKRFDELKQRRNDNDKEQDRTKDH